MANYNSCSVKRKPRAEKNLTTADANPPEALSTKAIWQIVKNANCDFPAFYLPHSPLFYLLWHALLTALEWARAGVGHCPLAITSAQNNDFWFFEKDAYSIRIDVGQFKAALKPLIRKELAVLPLAWAFIFSQSKSIGKSWKRKGGQFECTRAAFLDFVGQDGLSCRVLRKAAAAIQCAQISIKGEAYAALYNEASPLVFEQTPQKRARKTAKEIDRRARGVLLTVESGNRIFKDFCKVTHAMPRDAATVLNLRQFKAYIELKSARACGYESTALGNLLSAAGLGLGTKNRHAERFKKLGELLKKIADFDSDFKDVWLDDSKGKTTEQAQIRFSKRAAEPCAVETGESQAEPLTEQRPKVTRQKTTDAMPPALIAKNDNFYNARDAWLSGVVDAFFNQVKQRPKPPDKSAPKRPVGVLKAFLELGIAYLKNGFFNDTKGKGDGI